MAKDFISNINRAVPVEEEDQILIEGNHDGITELDNLLPPWWTYFFGSCVIFGIGYILYYHTFGIGILQTEEYNREMAIAEAFKTELLATKYAKVNENTVEALTSPESLANGEAIYMKNCASCHAKDGGGSIGPNFVDDNWLHGCDIKSVFKTVTYGVPLKGMISWSGQLNPIQIQEVSSFLMTFRGKAAAKPKAPEGEICK